MAELKPIESVLTVEEAVEECHKVMGLWQVGEMLESEATSRYSALLMLKKKLGGKPTPVKVSATDAKLQAIFKEIEAAGLLGHSKDDIATMILSGYTDSLAQNVSACMSIKKAAVLKQYSQIVPIEEWSTFVLWVDNKIENKIKTHTEGENAEPYKAIFELLIQSGQAAVVQGTPLPTLMSKPKKAVKKKPVADPVLKVTFTTPPEKKTDDYVTVGHLDVRVPALHYVPQDLVGLKVEYATPAAYQRICKDASPGPIPHELADQHNSLILEIRYAYAQGPSVVAKKGTMAFSLMTVEGKQAVVAEL